MSDWETYGGGYQKIYGENSAGTSAVLPIDGDAVTVAGPLVTTWVQSAVSFGSGGTEIIAANADRVYIEFQNDSDTVMYLEWTSGTPAVNTGHRLNASGATFDMSLSQDNRGHGMGREAR